MVYYTPYIKGVVSLSFGIYIHWPYCLSKCPYCDFYKEVRKNVPQEEIVYSYLEDLDFYYNLTSDRNVTSVFFGGGTPSLLSPSLINKIINHIAKRWKIAPDIEISLEANPNSHYPNMFENLKNAGINRLSLGVQALNDKDLRFLGRTHNLKQVYQAIDEVLQNFDNHSIDLIYARPLQKLDDWLDELKQVVTMGLKHISLYQLTIEPNTVFARKNIQPLDDEQAVEMYLATEDILSKYLYQKYEVSNFAIEGFESKHNLLYWTGGEYIGVGFSAHGRLTCFDGNLEQNSDVKKRFYATTHRCQLEEISQEEKAEELLLMGLRLVKGINKSSFEDICGINFYDFVNKRNLQNLIDDGYIKENEHYIWVTSKGFPVLNFITLQLVS